MKKKKHFQPQFDFNSLSSLECAPNSFEVILSIDSAQPTASVTSSNPVQQVICDVKNINMEQENLTDKKRSAKVEVEVITVSDNETKVINSNGDVTFISSEIVLVRGVKCHVVKVRREYADGGVYEEPNHYWQNSVSCKGDMRDWISLGKKCDW